jgi:hypothetical protein
MRRGALIVAIGLLTLPSVGIARDKSKPSAPRGNPGDWFPQNSYPADAKRKGEQGRVSVRLKVDKTGMPIACEVMESSGSSSLDAVTCRLALANGDSGLPWTRVASPSKPCIPCRVSGGS